MQYHSPSVAQTVKWILEQPMMQRFYEENAYAQSIQSALKGCNGKYSMHFDEKTKPG